MKRLNQMTEKELKDLKTTYEAVLIVFIMISFLLLSVVKVTIEYISYHVENRFVTFELSGVERDYNKDYLVHYITEDGGEVVRKFGKNKTVIYYTLKEGETPYIVIDHDDNSIQIYITQDTEIP